MKPLSKAAEAKIMAAIEATAEMVNGGMTPNDAIVKAASAAELPPGHINLMVHAYNTGRTTRQRQLGDSPFEKAADFDLADAAVILETLYPTDVKTAAVRDRESVVSVEYLMSPRSFIEARDAREKRAQAATVPVDWRMCDPPPPLPRDPRDVMKQAYHRSLENQKQVDEARRVATMSFQGVVDKMDALTEYFKQAGHIPYGDAIKEVEFRHGDLGVSLLTKLAEMHPHLKKEAATGAVYMGNSPLYTLVGEVISGMTAHVAHQTNYEKVAAEKAQDTERTLRPFVQPRPQSILEDPSSKQASPFAWGVAGGSAKDILSGVAKSIAPPNNSSLSQQALSSLTDPGHEASLRNIRTQAMLQDLMTNDSVISGYNPEAVLGAFNEIGEVAPRAADQRLIMQTLMRKRLAQGHLDPFEAEQLLSIEGKLKQRNEAKDGAPSTSIL